MRFPSEAKAAETVAKSLELGINYYETSSGYGDSELWLGRALGGQRKKVFLSTKSAGGEKGCMTADEVRLVIDASLRRLGTDYLDFYHAWRVNTPLKYASVTAKGGWIEGVLKAREEGIIRHVGITTHSTPAHIGKILANGIFEVLTVQYSLILQSYREVIAQAARSGVGVVVMGPLAGGLLTTPTPVLQQVFAPNDQITGALKYVLCDGGVSTVASGMTSAAQVAQNCASVEDMDLSNADYQDKVNARIRSLLGPRLGEFETALCGGCRYCVGVCPKKLGPHNIFKAYNMAMLGGEPKRSPKVMAMMDKIASECVRCGKCQTVCPQKISVPDHLETVRKFFSLQS
jgi:hypothetical protein